MKMLKVMISKCVVFCSLQSRFLLLFLTFAQVACAEADWTVLVYAQAKNNLHNFAYKNFNDMAVVGSGKHLNILVQWYQPEQQGVWRYKVEKGKMILDVCHKIKSDGNKSQDLVDAMRWAVGRYPAKNYSLVLWDHGMGIIDPVWGNHRPWEKANKFSIDPQMLKENPRIQIPGVTCDQKDVLDMTPDSEYEQACDLATTGTHRGILFNEQSKTYMTNETLTNALAQIKKSVLRNKKIDLLGMDACLMAMVEVGFQAHKYAKYMVGSQEVELAYGWNYMSIMKALSAGATSAEDAALAIVGSYKNYYKDKIQFYTQSAVDLEKMTTVKSMLDHLVHNIKLCSGLNKVAMKETIKRARRNCLQFSAASYIDLHSFCTELKKQVETYFEKKVSYHRSIGNLKSSVEGMLKSVEESVLANAAGTYLSRARGLSIYFPLHHIDGSYKRTDFAKESQWLGFIRDFIY